MLPINILKTTDVQEIDDMFLEKKKILMKTENCSGPILISYHVFLSQA